MNKLETTPSCYSSLIHLNPTWHYSPSITATAHRPAGYTLTTTNSQRFLCSLHGSATVGRAAMALLELPSSRLTINAVTRSLCAPYREGGGRALSPRNRPGEPQALAPCPPPPTRRGEGKEPRRSAVEPRRRVIYHSVDPGDPRGLPRQQQPLVPAAGGRSPLLTQPSSTGGRAHGSAGRSCSGTGSAGARSCGKAEGKRARGEGEQQMGAASPQGQAGPRRRG